MRRALQGSMGLDYTCGVLLIVMTVVCFFQVVGRYLLLIQAIGWAEEFSRLCFVWAVFLGAAVAVQRGTHLGVEVLIERFPQDGRLRAGVGLFTHLCMVIIALVLLYHGYQFASSMAADRLTTLGYSRNLFYFPAPVAGLLMSIWLFHRLYKDMRLLLGSRPFQK